MRKFLINACIAAGLTTYCYAASEETTLSDCSKPVLVIGKIEPHLLVQIHQELIPCLASGEDQTLKIYSDGGSIDTAVAIFDLIKSFDSRGVLTTHILGPGSSAATTIFLAGDVRRVACHGNAVIHQISQQVCFNTTEPSRISQGADELMMIQDTQVSILSTVTGMSLHDAQDLIRQNAIHNAEKLLALGIATEIVGCN